MSNYQFVIITVLAGVGTFLIRFLPLLLKERKTSTPYNRLLHQALAAIGPAAIVALLVVSLAGELRPDSLHTTLLPIFAGLLGVVLGRKLGKGNIAIATLMGIAVYALATASLL